MVLCQYYQQGSCRFGSTCRNEHLDLRQLIKNEIEPAIKGSQWPLSCFGPMKGKPCIPNFIEDQSFEEIRYEYLEAKARNDFTNYHQKLSQQILDAQNKLKSLLIMNNETYGVIVNLYNLNMNTVLKPVIATNPFGMATMGNANTSATDSTSLFGKSTLSSNPFASTTNTDGITNANNSQQIFSGLTGTTSLFGGDNNNLSVSNDNPFASTASATSGGNLFGSNTFAQTSTFGASTFGGQQNTNSIFGGQSSFMNQNQVAPAATGPFSQPANGLFANAQTPQSSLFGGVTNQTQQSSVFGGATQQPTFGQSTGLFAAANNALTQQPLSGGNIFGAQTNTFGNNTTNQQQGFFGNANQQQQQQQQPQQGLFGVAQPQTNVFGSPVPNTIAPQATNVFAQAANQQGFGTMQQPSLIPATVTSVQNSQYATQPNQSVFGNVAQNLFESTQAKIFGNSAEAPSVFGGQPPPPPFPGTEQTNQSVFGGGGGSFPGQFNATPSINEDLIYSKLENLTQEQIDAFSAPTFELGKIPTVPPPKELC